MSTIDSRNSVFPTLTEIVPSWARWAKSLGLAARQLGIDSLVTALLTNDFGHVPRSKIFYARVSVEEIWSGVNKLYSQFGWGSAVPPPDDATGVGCRISPTFKLIAEIEAWLAQQVKQYTPGKRTTISVLLKYADSFVHLTAFRMMLLLALRRRAQLTLQSGDFENARTAVIDDKQIPGLEGGLPVPLSAAFAQVRNAWSAHCRFLLARLSTLGHEKYSYATHLRQIIAGAAVELLVISQDGINVQAYGTQMLLNALKPNYVLPPDFGRKLSENALRHLGAAASDVDSVLRHEVVGQERLASISDFHLTDWSLRLGGYMDQISSELFGDYANTSTDNAKVAK